MESKEKAIKESYAKNLKPFDYVEEHGDKFFNLDETPFALLPLTLLYDCLHSGRFKGTRMLDLGSGAVVHNVASASAFFPNIIMSDYVEDNCEELKRWLSGQSKLKQFLDIPAKLEGYGGNLESGKQLLESRIRKSVKQVVRCDVLDSNIFLEEVKPEVAPPYDLIVSILCLENASPDYDSYVKALKRINKLLRPGGGLMLAGFLNGMGKWHVKGNYFNYLRISEEDVTKALKESGFGNIDMKTQKPNANMKHDKYYCLAAEKL